MTSEPTLHATGLRHRYPRSDTVLENLHIEVGAGEFVSIIGPSGSGKSTLLQVIGGLLRPQQGRVLIDGADVTGRRGHVSYMPQQPSLLPWRTIERNILLGEEVSGRSARVDQGQLGGWLERGGLADYRAAYPFQLSGGMLQRAAFMRALASPQELILLDEPFSALDALTRVRMQSWLLDVWQEARRAVLLVTHNIEEALVMSDRVYVLSARPARVLEVIGVPFARPRDVEVIDSPEFISLRRHITRLLET